jgi:putative addiction module component (TIGR02574 family)
MSNQIDELITASMSLSLEERAELAERLLLSIDNPPESEIERLWLDEADRRLNVFRSVNSKTIPAEDVFRQALSDLS